MKHKAITLVMFAIFVTGCSVFKELASPFIPYSGIKMNQPMDLKEFRAKIDTFAKSKKLTIIDRGNNYSTITGINFFLSSTPYKCDMDILVVNDTVHAKIDPCSQFSYDTYTWSTPSRAFVNSIRNDILKNFFYSYIEPGTAKADSVLKETPFPSLSTNADIDAEALRMSEIYKRHK